jgi:hypothetical protein
MVEMENLKQLKLRKDICILRRQRMEADGPLSPLLTFETEEEDASQSYLLFLF